MHLQFRCIFASMVVVSDEVHCFERCYEGDFARCYVGTAQNKKRKIEDPSGPMTSRISRDSNE